MKTVNELIREHILNNAGVRQGETNLPELPELLKTEWSNLFESLQRNRLITGAMRYGLLNQPGKNKYDRVSDMIHRLKIYQETGNDELLVDVANLAMMEFEEGVHPKKHFKSTDDGYHTKSIRR